jgi:peptidoglycan/LPS O-acetylase OafA/YrhL
MTASTTFSTSPASAAKRLAAAVVLLAAAFAVVSPVLNPDSLRSTAIRFVAIALTGFLAARGIRWARLLLIVLTGLAALYAAVLAVVRPMPLGWRGVFLIYGLGTVLCIIGLFREPAASHFADRKPAPSNRGRG